MPQRVAQAEEDNMEEMAFRMRFEHLHPQIIDLYLRCCGPPFSKESVENALHELITKQRNPMQ